MQQFDARSMNRRRFAGIAAGAAFGLSQVSAFAQSAGPTSPGKLTIYCGRNEALVGPMIPRIAEVTGIDLDVRFGNTAELAAQILEEGSKTPAGLYFCQDAGALGALARENRFAVLPAELLDQVQPQFRSPDGVWIGLSGRVRVLLYNPEVTDPTTLPKRIIDLPQAELNGPIGWAPSNAPFQSFVTALRVVYGEDGARDWLEGIIATDPVTFEDNGPQVSAIASQEVAVGLVNHYYLFEARNEDPEISIENYYFPEGDLGSLINVGGAGIISGSGQEEQSAAVIRYLLSGKAQTYFAEETLEYPLAAGVEAIPELVPFSELDAPDLDLTELADLQGTLKLMTEVGLINLN